LIVSKTHGTYPLTASPVAPQDEHSTSQAVKEKAKKPKKQGKKLRSTKGKTSLSLQQWHERLEYLNNEDVQQLANSETAVHLSTIKQIFCEPCIFGKQRSNLSHKQQERAKAKLDFIHVDLTGGKNSLFEKSDITQVDLFDKEGISFIQKGLRYFMLITDNYSRYR
jgi:hypothetical protein